MFGEFSHSFKKYLVYLVILLSLISGCDVWIRITRLGGGGEVQVEVDKRLFPVYKKDGSRNVWYAVEVTDGCQISGIYPFWMDKNDPQDTELLKDWERILAYGVEDLTISINRDEATFHIVRLPEKIINVHLISEDVKNDRRYCYYEAETKIQNQDSLLSHVWVENRGNKVDWIDVYGLLLPERTKEVIERIKN